MGSRPITVSPSSSLLGLNMLTAKQKAPKGAFYSDTTLKKHIKTSYFRGNLLELDRISR
jgi:hypothetical protein